MTWKRRIIGALKQASGPAGDDGTIHQLKQALDNLGKQHKWGDITDADYLQQREPLKRELAKLEGNQRSSAQAFGSLPNLEHSAQLLEDLQDLWTHPGVTDQQREAFIAELFARVTIQGSKLMAIEPKGEYQPLFATMLAGQRVGYYRGETSLSAKRVVVRRISLRPPRRDRHGEMIRRSALQHDKVDVPGVRPGRLGHYRATES